MQWTAYDHGGFSTAPPAQLVRPIVAKGDYGFEQVKVAAMRADPGSLVNVIAALMRTRRECGAIGIGTWRALETGQDAVLARRYDLEGSAIVVLNNLSCRRCTVATDLTEREIATATDLFGDRTYEAIEPGERMRLHGLGYRWMRLGGVY